MSGSNTRHPRQNKDIWLMLLATGLFLIGAVAILFFLPGARNAVADEASSAIPAKVSLHAPVLALSSLDGKAVSLNDYRGKTVLVNNWATWCPPCRIEMPALQAYYEAHAHQNFVIIVIDSGEPADQVAAFVSQYDLTFRSSSTWQGKLWVNSRTGTYPVPTSLTRTASSD